MKTWIFTIVTSLLMATAVTASEHEATTAMIDTIKKGNEAGGCFYIHTVDSHRVIDKNHMLVYAPSRSKPWLLEFSNACPLLRNGDAVMFEGSNGQICGQAGDALKAHNQNCGIASIISISIEEADALKALSK